MGTGVETGAGVQIRYESPDSEAVIVTTDIPEGNVCQVIQETRRYKTPESLVRGVGRERIFRFVQSLFGVMEIIGGTLYGAVKLANSPEDVIPTVVIAGATMISGIYIGVNGIVNYGTANDIFSEANRLVRHTEEWKIVLPTEG